MAITTTALVLALASAPWAPLAAASSGVRPTPTTTAVHVTAPRLDRAPPSSAPPRHDRVERLSAKQRRTARTFVAAGGAILGVFYLTGTLVAATQIDEIREDGALTPEERDPLRISRLMAVPVLGPLVASPLGESRGDKAGLAGFGIMQAMGAAYLVAGGVMLARDRRARRRALQLQATPRLGGGTLTLRGRF